MRLPDPDELLNPRQKAKFGRCRKSGCVREAEAEVWGHALCGPDLAIWTQVAPFPLAFTQADWDAAPDPHEAARAVHKATSDMYRAFTAQFCNQKGESK